MSYRILLLFIVLFIVLPSFANAQDQYLDIFNEVVTSNKGIFNGYNFEDDKSAILKEWGDDYFHDEESSFDRCTYEVGLDGCKYYVVFGFDDYERLDHIEGILHFYNYYTDFDSTSIMNVYEQFKTRFNASFNEKNLVYSTSYGALGSESEWHDNEEHFNVVLSHKINTVEWVMFSRKQNDLLYLAGTKKEAKNDMEFMFIEGEDLCGVSIGDSIEKVSNTIQRSNVYDDNEKINLGREYYWEFGDNTAMRLSLEYSEQNTLENIYLNYLPRGTCSGEEGCPERTKQLNQLYEAIVSHLEKICEVEERGGMYGETPYKSCLIKKNETTYVQKAVRNDGKYLSICIGIKDKKYRSCY